MQIYTLKCNRCGRIGEFALEVDRLVAETRHTAQTGHNDYARGEMELTALQPPGVLEPQCGHCRHVLKHHTKYGCHCGCKLVQG